VYFDPPYVPVSATSSFVSYSAGGFDEQAQERLALTAAALADRGVSVMVSNSVAPLVRKLYAGFWIEEVSAHRAINSRGDRRGKVGELVMCAGPAFKARQPA
jgi:DNA adenine methylase